MNSILKFLFMPVNQYLLMKKLGLKGWLRYRLASNGDEVTLNIQNRPIVGRKGTPDFGVAEMCLSGEFEILRYLLPRNYSGTIIDAGGYIGTSALALHDLFPEATIIVVEPSESNIKILKKNVQRVKNIQVVYGALVGAQREAAQLIDRGTGGRGFTIIKNPKDRNSVQALHQTPAFTISQLVADVSQVGLIKLDIEGGEVDLLQNDVETLKQVHVVFAELHDRIIDGCSDLFFAFSKNRIMVKDGGEKFLSVKR